MGWQVHVSSYAREAYQALDGHLREELRDQVDAFTDDPFASLRRPVPPEPPDTLVFEYRSAIDDQLRVILYFDPPAELDTQRLVLLAIRLRSDPIDTD